MPSFGQMLRYYRRQSHDPVRGGLLTQERLGELLGVALGDRGYTGAAVSEWERDRSKINADDRLVLVNLVKVLHESGGLPGPDAADELLRSGNYRDLDESERWHAFPDIDQINETDVSSSKVRAERKQPISSATRFTTPSAISSPQRKKQLILLEKVKNFWVEGVLEKSVEDSDLLDLSLERCDESIDHPWQNVVGSAIYQRELTSNDRTVLEVYQVTSRALLILGEPGAGKTTTLITLARELILLAELNPSEPIPVILNLASWEERRQTLAKWVIEELTAKYQIPRRIGSKWLESDELLLLLDGLDEVSDRFRPRCIRAINRFREMRGLTGIVICCRSEEYWNAGSKLNMGGAIAVQPLSPDQVIAYLRSAGYRLAALKSGVEHDKNLKELARSPLMLNVMDQAYSFSQENLTGVLTDESETSQPVMAFWQRHLFETYVQRMFQRRASSDRFPPDITKQWLNWLASEMFSHNRAHFLIEQMQPSWMSHRRWRWIYMLLTGVLMGLVGGIIMWLFLQLLRESNPLLPAPLSDIFANLLQITRGRAEALTLILTNILLGIVVAVLQTRYYEQLRYQQGALDSLRWRYWRHLALLGFSVGALTMITVLLVGLPQLALIWATAEVVLYITAARYVYGRSFFDEIRTVEALAWSWLSAGKGLVVGLFLALIAELLGLLFYKAPVGIQSAVILGFGGFILGGLRGRRVEVKSRANQGIYLSLRNSAIAAAISGLLIGALAWLVRTPRYGFLAGILSFVIAGSLLGGSNVIKHFLLRFLLWLEGDIPWRYPDFLDYAANLTFLRKVGGSYIFIHRLLQQYFASVPLPTQKPGLASAIVPPELERLLSKSSGA